MITADIIQKLKRSNVSVNADLTTQRTKDALKAAKRAEKNEIDALAGVNRVSINRVYATGNISAKVAIAMAQVLNIDPFFLTGEADERGECTDETLQSFLTAKGYADLIEEPVKPARKTRAKRAPAASIEEAPAPVDETPAPVVYDLPVPAAESQIPDVQEVTPDHSPIKSGLLHDDEMTEEEATTLLHSLFIQAKYSPFAKASLRRVKKLLTNDVS